MVKVRGRGSFVRLDRCATSQLAQDTGSWWGV